MFPNVSDYSQIFQIARQSSEIFPNNLQCSNMFPNFPHYFRIFNSVLECSTVISIIARYFRTIQTIPNTNRMSWKVSVFLVLSIQFFNIPEHSRVFWNVSQWSRIVSYFPEHSKLFPNILEHRGMLLNTLNVLDCCRNF